MSKEVPKSSNAILIAHGGKVNRRKVQWYYPYFKLQHKIDKAWKINLPSGSCQPYFFFASHPIDPQLHLTFQNYGLTHSLPFKGTVNA